MSRDRALREDLDELNFWPSFADLMLSIALLLILILSLIAAMLTVGNVDMKPTEQRQQKMVVELATAYKIELKDSSANPINLFSEEAGINLTIKNELDKQLLTFSDYVLFPQDVAELSPKGKKLLNLVGNVIKDQLGDLKEIQIQGHADTDSSKKFASNLDLAAHRAMGVFQFFKENVGIDPAKCLMSATSFGEFKPADRKDDDYTFDASKLTKANVDNEGKTRNRRIEVLLFYRTKKN